MGRKMLGIALVVLSLVVAHPAWADYQAGQRALDAGNVDEALAQWRVAANAGDRRAMLALGRLHVKGLGVPQSYVEAHAWFNLAASQRRGGGGGRAGRARGEDDAGADRDCAGTRDGVAPERSASPGPPTSAPPSPAAPPAAVDSDPPPPRAIREAQALLGALGYRPGPADGIWGRRTGAAYRAFLREVGLPDAETLTPEALRALRTVAQRIAGGQEAGRGARARVVSVVTQTGRIGR